MPREGAVYVRGFKELQKASLLADRALRSEQRTLFREVGEPIRSEAALRFAAIDRRSAAGYRVRVRQRGVIVEQSLRKTTGKHPEYGALQMRRALLPAQQDQAPATFRRMERAIDKVCDLWERSYPVR
jgi:hypothetical protein